MGVASANPTPDASEPWAPDSWRTRPAAQQPVWPDEGALTHSLHTIIIDRQGKLAANFEGNEFSAEQLGDFVEAVLDQKE